MLEPTDEEEAETGQLVGLVLVAEPLLAATAVAHSFVLLVFLFVPFCYLLPGPNHCAAAAKILRAAAAGIEIEGVGCLLV